MPTNTGLCLLLLLSWILELGEINIYFYYLRRCENWLLSLYPSKIRVHNLTRHGG